MEYFLWAIIVLLVLIMLFLSRLCYLVSMLISTVRSESHEMKNLLFNIEDELPRKSAHQREIEARQWAQEEQEAKRAKEEREKLKTSN